LLVFQFVAVSRSWLSRNTRRIGPDSWSVQRALRWFSQVKPVLIYVY